MGRWRGGNSAPNIFKKMIVEIISGLVAAVVSVIAWKFYKQNKELILHLKQSESKIKSLYVLHGQAMEHLAPFSKQFTGERKEINFLGKPIDFIGFHKDSITFYEIKTGESQLSSKQKAIKNLIEKKKVEFKELRF